MAQAVLSTPTPNDELMQVMRLLVDIYFDLSCQDLPPAFEDTVQEFWGSPNGWFIRFLSWSPSTAAAADDDDEGEPTPDGKIKIAVLATAEMWTKMYSSSLLGEVPALVQAVWSLASSQDSASASSTSSVFANTRKSPKNDALIAQALRFLSSAIRSGMWKDLFGARETIESIVRGVVVPNASLSESEIEGLEDAPLEWIRRDISGGGWSGGAGGGAGSGSEGTRRGAAGDVLGALLVGANGMMEGSVTEVVGAWVEKGLAEYGGGVADGAGWKAKDAAIFLFMGVAARSGNSAVSCLSAIH